MGTRSRIGIKLSDSSILSVYHHWDGYPEWLGVVLEREYNTREKVAELIDGGDMSSCFSDSEYDYEKQEFIKRDPRPTYYAERGEDCPPRIDNNINEYLDNGEEFAYIFDLDNKWICYDRHEFYDDKDPEIVPIPANHPE